MAEVMWTLQAADSGFIFGAAPEYHDAPEKYIRREGLERDCNL